MGFHFRGWFGAWMAGEGGSAASRARQPWQWWLGRFRRAKGAGLGFYRRMGVTGGRFPSPGRQCGAGGVQNRGSSDWRQWWPAMASWQHRKGGGAWRPPRATGELGFGNTGALEGGLGRAATRGAARWLRRRTALPVGRAQGGERLKKRSVAIS